MPGMGAAPGGRGKGGGMPKAPKPAKKRKGFGEL
jgi:signal recognition particle subunit SRP54